MVAVVKDLVVGFCPVVVACFGLDVIKRSVALVDIAVEVGPFVVAWFCLDVVIFVMAVVDLGVRFCLVVVAWFCVDVVTCVVVVIVDLVVGNCSVGEGCFGLDVVISVVAVVDVFEIIVLEYIGAAVVVGWDLAVCFKDRVEDTARIVLPVADVISGVVIGIVDCDIDLVDIVVRGVDSIACWVDVVVKHEGDI